MILFGNPGPDSRFICAQLKEVDGDFQHYVINPPRNEIGIDCRPFDSLSYG
jgi:hypothetical protein